MVWGKIQPQEHNNAMSQVQVASLPATLNMHYAFGV